MIILVRELDLRSDILKKKIKNEIKKIFHDDYIYFDGKLTSLVIAMLCFLVIMCFIIGFIIFK